MQKKDQTLFEEQIAYHFRRKELLKQAFTHSSFANEMKIHKWESYERLEFLGDAVLEMVSSEFLYGLYPEKPEGELSKIRAYLVCEPSHAFCARKLGLEEFILLGRGEECTGGRQRDSIISDVMEAVIGALFLDGGIDAAKTYIMKYVLSDLDEKRLFYDAKSILQEHVQKHPEQGTLSYVLLKEEGPDHDKSYEVQAMIGSQAYEIGTGRSKQAAEPQAAYKTLLSLHA